MQAEEQILASRKIKFRVVPLVFMVHCWYYILYEGFKLS
jgi:hypothetical protein